MASVEYAITKRTLWIKGVKEDRYIARLVSTGKDTTKDIAKKSIMQGTISDIEFPQFMDTFVKMVKTDLMSGFKVRMGMLGTLVPKIECKLVANLDDCDSATIRKKTVGFEQSEDMKDEIKNVTFRKANLNVKHM